MWLVYHTRVFDGLKSKKMPTLPSGGTFQITVFLTKKSFCGAKLLFFFELRNFFCKKICTYQKKAVPLRQN